MGESHRHHHHLLHHHFDHQLIRPPPPIQHGRPPAHHSRLVGVRGGGGEIVEVQGGHIVRSIGRKDRHSKVYTAKGPRDRRVRLAAHTAIQFYDVQDRLGYDRPSKAVDWLIKNAKAAIDELAELPSCRPMAAAGTSEPPQAGELEDQDAAAAGSAEEKSEKPLPEAEAVPSSAYGFGASSFLPPSLDSDAIADTIKSFFPMAATSGASSSPAMSFQSYPPELLPRSGSQAQDLRLSLQSFQDPVLLQHHHPQPTTHHHHQHHHHHQPTSPAAEQALFSSSSTHLPFEASSSGWPELNQRMFSWNAPAETGGSGGGSGSAGGYILLPPQQQALPMHPVLGQSPFLSQRGPLQSSNSPHVRAWADPSAAAEAVALPPGPSFSATVGFAAGGLSGFRIPARIQGEEEHDGTHKKPSSASSASRH